MEWVQILSFSSSKPIRPDALPPPPAAELKKTLHVQNLTIDWLAGDGSDRCYYRLSSPEFDDQSLVLMQLSGTDAEALKAKGYDWVTIAELLNDQKITIPKLVATMPDFAALVIEDYGNVTFETQVLKNHTEQHQGRVDKLYQDAVNLIGQMLKIPKSNSVWCQRAFDAARLEWELKFFVANFSEPIARWNFTPSESQEFAHDVQQLAEFLAGRADYFVHRDYHSRNLMCKNGIIAVIDFQDARLGPSSYDLVSLIFDSYVPFDEHTRVKMLEASIAQLGSSLGVKVADDIKSSWRPMLLQRQLKALGSFGYLTLKKNRGNYLRYVEPALATLSQDLVFDKRWPFLSGTLLKRLGKEFQNGQHP